MKKIDVSFSRYWIYSHHIYSKIKRREIIELAKENNITGFCLPGKPGIVCIEGSLVECDYWWQKVSLFDYEQFTVDKLIGDLNTSLIILFFLLQFTDKSDELAKNFSQVKGRRSFRQR